MRIKIWHKIFAKLSCDSYHQSKKSRKAEIFTISFLIIYFDGLKPRKEGTA